MYYLQSASIIHNLICEYKNTKEKNQKKNYKF